MPVDIASCGALNDSKLAEFYDHFLDFTFIISTLLYTLSMYIVLTRSSKEMSAYRLYLALQFTSSFLFDLTLTLLKPAMFPPFLLFYGHGILARFGTMPTYALYGLFLISCIAMGISVLISALHRLSKMLALLRHRLFRYLEDSMLPLKLGCLLVPAGALVIIGPLAMAHMSFEELRNATLSQAPSMECVFDQRSSIVGFESVDANVWYEFCMQELVILLVFGLLLITALNVGCFVLIRRQRLMMSKKSYDMNIMLYKTLTVQMVLILLFLVIPAIVSGIALQFKSSFANDILMSSFSVASTHAFIEFGCTLYFIKRYRLYITRRIRVALDYIWPNRNKSRTENVFRVTYFTSRSTG